MAFLNVNLGILAYQDGPASQRPNVRFADMSWSLMGIPTDKVQQMAISLAPGETQTITSTQRPIVFNPATQFQITSPAPGAMRITAPAGFRTAKSSGDATTQWQLQTSPSGDVVRATAIGGTLPDLTAVIPGDQITFGIEWQAPNQGDFMILSRGTNYVEFMSQYGSSETVVAQLNICNNGPIQIGDILDISDLNFSAMNQGSFPITRVTSQFIEVLNPSVYAQTVTGVTAFSIYPFAYKWLIATVDHKISMSLNGGTGFEIEPPVEDDLVKNPGICLKRGKVFSVSLTNLSLSQAEGMLLLAQ